MVHECGESDEPAKVMLTGELAKAEDGDVAAPTNPCVDCVCESICAPAEDDPYDP